MSRSPRSSTSARLRGRRRPGGQGGQVVPLVVVVLVLAAVLLLALVPLARGGAERARAVAAADAAALAGAAEGEAAARELARRNGAELVVWKALAGDVWVQVAVGGAVAEARARRVQGP
jgi:hypothetical protein